eukprot:2974683-Pyramimonas_sp.AAC.3
MGEGWTTYPPGAEEGTGGRGTARGLPSVKHVTSALDEGIPNVTPAPHSPPPPLTPLIFLLLFRGALADGLLHGLTAEAPA